MQVERLPIAGLVRIVPQQFADHRGAFSETYSKRALIEAIGDVDFVQDNHSISRKSGTVRGLHFQLAPHAQAKLVRVMRGAIYDVALDLRADSPTFGRHVSLELSAANRAQLFIPSGLAHGFCTLEDDTEVLYKTDAYYSAEHDRAVRWNDPELAIDWPVSAGAAILSDKDRNAPLLSQAMRT